MKWVAKLLRFLGLKMSEQEGKEALHLAYHIHPSMRVTRYGGLYKEEGCE